MIDSDDGDFFLLASPGGWIGLIFVLAAICLYLMAASNEEDCETRTCQAGKVSKLLDHECVCVEEAK